MEKKDPSEWMNDGWSLPTRRSSRSPISSRRSVVEYNFIWNPNETYKDFFEPLDDRKEAINDAAMMEDSNSNQSNDYESGSVGES